MRGREQFFKLIACALEALPRDAGGHVLDPVTLQGLEPTVMAPLLAEGGFFEEMQQGFLVVAFEVDSLESGGGPARRKSITPLESGPRST